MLSLGQYLVALAFRPTDATYKYWSLHSFATAISSYYSFIHYKGRYAKGPEADL